MGTDIFASLGNLGGCLLYPVEIGVCFVFPVVVPHM